MNGSTGLSGPIRLIATWGIVGANDGAAPYRADTDLDWSRLLARIKFERISGLAVEAAAAGAFELTDQQATELLILQRQSMTWCLAIEQKLLALAERFDVESIGFAVLKGPALAHSVYAEPCFRPFADLDLLVRSRDYNRACRVLADLGHRRQRPEPRPGWEARFGKGSVHVDPDDGIEIDLHRTLALGPFGQWIEGDELLEVPAAFELAGRSIPRISDTAMLINVALHGALGWAEPRVAPLRDVVEVAAKGHIDRVQLLDWVERWHLGVVLARAGSLVESELRLSPPDELRSLGSSGSARDQRLMGFYIGDQRVTAGLSLATLGAIEGIGAKSRYVSALLFPTREFLTARGRGDAAAGFRGRLQAASNTVGRLMARPVNALTALGRTDR